MGIFGDDKEFEEELPHGTDTLEQEAEAGRIIRELAGQNVASHGTPLGTYGFNVPEAYSQSTGRYDQTNAERVAQQQSNFIYGGYEGGAADAVAAARNAVGPAASTLGMYGSEYFDQAATGAYNMQQGVYNMNNQADALAQYAQQGPGASVAQAQLQANTAQAMRQQLAMAGSGRGAGGGASAYRNAAAQQAMLQGQGNAQASMLQAQEAQNWRQAQMQAMGMAGDLYGQGAGIGQQYALGMSDQASQAQVGAGNLGLGGEQLAHQIQGADLSGRQAYESNLTDIYGIDKGIGKQPSGEMTTKDWLSLGADALGTWFSTM
jgi:hypothetical protein